MYPLLLGALLHWLLLPLGARVLHRSAKLLAKWARVQYWQSSISKCVLLLCCTLPWLRSGISDVVKNLTFLPLWSTAWAFETWADLPWYHLSASLAYSCSASCSDRRTCLEEGPDARPALLYPLSEPDWCSLRKWALLPSALLVSKGRVMRGTIPISC